jgi:hypothetical protein
MPGPITYAAVALLARDRIGQIRRALQAKKDAGNAKEIDLHVLYLATQAESMMSASQPVIEPPIRLYGPPLTDHVSRFTLLGAIGPDLPRYAAYFVPGQRWLFDTLHKGTPDTDRERALANSTNLVFDFWRRVGPAIDAGTSDQKKRDEAKAKMQAYVLGHLCHIATDVLSHPYFETIEARLSVPPAGTNPGIRFMTRDDVAGAFDARVSDQFFARGTDTRNKKWADWFPTPSDVPTEFAQSMSDSITAVYTARAQGMPLFDETFGKIDPAPPALSPALISESIDYFRTIMEIERVWTLGDWLGATAAMFLPMGFAYFGALALPLGKDLSRSLTAADGANASAIRTYESIVYPVAVSSLGPLVTMIIVSASGRGLRAEGVTGWIQAGLSLVASIGFFATLGGEDAARWILWFVVPLVLAVAQIVFVLIRGASENSRKLLFMGPLVQIALAMLFMLLYRVWLHNGVEAFQGASPNYLEAFGDFAAWLAIVVVLWFVTAILFRYVFSSHVPDDQNLFANGDPRTFLRLYDETTLVHDLGAAITAENFGALSYPPARRPLFKIWWEPAVQPNATMLISHDRLLFSWPGLATPGDQTVFAPVFPTTIDSFATALAKIITNDAGKGILHVASARDDEKTLELAPGLIFGDAGDDKTDLVGHNAAAFVAVPLPTTEATAFTLYHTVRPRLAERMGQSGGAGDSVRQAASRPGSMLTQTVANPKQYTATNGTDGKAPFMQKLFLPGDIIEIASGGATGEQRIVEQIVNDTNIVVSSPFQFAIPAAGIAYKRAANDRSVRVAYAAQVVPAGLNVGAGPNDITASVGGTPRFGTMFMVGDIVEISAPPPVAPATVPLFQPFRRTVVAVKDQTLVGTPPIARDLLQLDAPLSLVNSPAVLTRVSDEEADGFPFVADPSDVLGDGIAVMNDAADLAALLCLGGASRLSTSATPVTPPGAAKPVHRVSQVFRNWNLDRRRVNEWKLMVTGGAESERRGDFRVDEEAAPVDPADASETFSDAFINGRIAADSLVRERGWLNIFRGYVDMAARARTDSSSAEVFRPGQPANRDLSRAMAYLIDATEGVAP